jgi:hypothetical protein
MIRGLVAAALIWAGPALAQDKAWHAEVLTLADELGQAIRSETGMDWIQPRTHPAIRIASAKELGVALDEMDRRIRAGYAMSTAMLDVLIHQQVPGGAIFGTTAQDIRWGIVPFRVQMQRVGRTPFPETCSLFLIFNDGRAWFAQGLGKPQTDAILRETLPDLAKALPDSTPGCTQPVS